MLKAILAILSLLSSADAAAVYSPSSTTYSYTYSTYSPSYSYSYSYSYSGGYYSGGSSTVYVGGGGGGCIVFCIVLCILCAICGNKNRNGDGFVHEVGGTTTTVTEVTTVVNPPNFSYPMGFGPGVPPPPAPPTSFVPPG